MKVKKNVSAESLTAYLNDISKKSKLISIEEEKCLYRKFKKGCKESREKLINANLRMVYHIANRYKGLDINLSDIIQEGNIGLIKAVDRFKLGQKKWGFRSYLWVTIWGCLHGFVKKEMKRNNLEEDIETEHSQSACSTPSSSKKVDSSISLERLLNRVKLSEKEKEVIQKFYFEKESMIGIAESWKCSREWVRRVRNKALEKLRKALNN